MTCPNLRLIQMTERNTVVVDGGGGSSSTAIVAIIVLVLLVVAGWWFFFGPGAGSQSGDTDVNVNLPSIQVPQPT